MNVGWNDEPSADWVLRTVESIGQRGGHLPAGEGHPLFAR